LRENSGAPTGSGWAEWRTAIESEVQSLKAELAATKAQERNSLLVNQRNDDDIIPSIVLVPEESEAESQVSLPVNQDDDIKAFEAAYVSLERDHHAVIWQLRERLDWPRGRFDAVLRQLRDEGRYQPMQGAETKGMTETQLAGAFVDENNFRNLTIMRVSSAATEQMTETPTPMDEPQPDPAALASEDRAVPPPKKGRKKLERPSAASDSPTPPRKRGRPSKVELARRVQQTIDAEAKAPEDLPA
jgi:hypothetical protein